MTDKGILFVVSGPSGTGKGTILENFNNQFGSYNTSYSVSATTRNPREGEVDGVNYHFLTEERFSKMVEDNGFLEWAPFCDHRYGTPKKPVMEYLESGTDVILEIETDGAMQVKKQYPEAVLIFVFPPSLSELRRRLTDRGTEEIDVIEQRLEKALKEFTLADSYDYIIVNDDIGKAVFDFKSIIDAERLKININKKTIVEVLEK